MLKPLAVGLAVAVSLAACSRERGEAAAAKTAKSFTGHWRLTRTAASGEKLEELLDAHVSGKDFVIVTKTGPLQRALLYSQGQWTEITSIPGAGQRRVSSDKAIPGLVRMKMFWLQKDGLKEAADQSNPPGNRPMTLFVREPATEPAADILKEWVDKETNLVLYREHRFGQQGESLELIGLEVGPVEAAVFNPEAY